MIFSSLTSPKSQAQSESNCPQNSAALDKRAVLVGVHQVVEFLEIVSPNANHPALVERALIDGLRGVFELLVHHQNLAADRGIQVRRRLDALEHAELLAALDRVALVGQLNVDDIAQQVLGVPGNADGDAAVFLFAGPLVLFGESVTFWNIHNLARK